MQSMEAGIPVQVILLYTVNYLDYSSANNGPSTFQTHNRRMAPAPKSLQSPLANNTQYLSLFNNAFYLKGHQGALQSCNAN